jgi:hypothetical protein
MTNAFIDRWTRVRHHPSLLEVIGDLASGRSRTHIRRPASAQTLMNMLEVIWLPERPAVDHQRTLAARVGADVVAELLA